LGTSNGFVICYTFLLCMNVVGDYSIYKGLC